MNRRFSALLTVCFLAAGCAEPQASIPDQDRAEGSAVTGSRIPRRDRASSEMVRSTDGAGYRESLEKRSGDGVGMKGN